MAQPAIQTSFNSGEWAPELNARVDLAKYHQGAALLRNFFIDYRGGATARGGTKYILQCFKSEAANPVRLIGFQASLQVSYLLEFGDFYLRFFSNGAPVVEASLTITAATAASPGVFTHNAHGYFNGQWVLAKTFAGGTSWSTLNGNYYIIANKTANTFELTDLQGNALNTTGFGVYTASSGTTSRVYKLDTVYSGPELATLKFAQNVDRMVFTHPNHPPYELRLISAANWTLAAIIFGSTLSAPGGGAVGSTLSAGNANYAYVVTSVDTSGQESAPTAFLTLANAQDMRTVAGTNTISWTAVAGAASYNVYKAEIRYGALPPAGTQFGFIGNVTGVALIDSNIEQDFAFGPPIPQNPFSGSGVQTLTLVTPGVANTVVPSVTFTASPGITAQAFATLGAYAVAVSAGGVGYTVGDVLGLDPPGYGVLVRVTSIGTFGDVTSIDLSSSGAITGAGIAVPANPRGTNSGTGHGCTVNLSWRVILLSLSNPGTGYLVTPTVTLGGNTTDGTATATLGAPSSGNPTVPAYHQQRLYLMGPVLSPQQLNASQPGSYYNFDISFPLQPTDAFQGTLVAGQLNAIQSAISQPQGLILLTDRQAWLLNGGSPGSGIDATNPVANAHIFTGAAGPPPIVAVDDILFVQSKNSIVRDLIFDFGKQIYTGKDISVLSSHLFYGYKVLEWCYAEEPFKLIWAVRNDGQLLCLTFLKEQELCAWAHSDTQGTFSSTASVVESTAVGNVDAAYFVVQRQVAGQTLFYIERMSELYYPTGLTDAWCVDAGLQYNDAATLSFSGAQHLAGLTVTGLATDNLGGVTVIPAFTMAASGAFTLSAPALPATGYTRVTVGIAYTPQLKTLSIDLGEPTIQGKMKKIPAVTVRVAQTLGLQIGSDFDANNLVDMQDLVRGNVGKDTNEVVTDLVTGDALETIDPNWTVPGQYCIQQSSPMPASILGVMPQIVVGDTGKPRQ